MDNQSVTEQGSKFTELVGLCLGMLKPKVGVGIVHGSSNTQPVVSKAKPTADKLRSLSCTVQLILMHTTAENLSRELFKFHRREL